MANVYVSSASYSAVAAWQAATVYGAGAIVRQSSVNVGSERCFRTAAGGTSGGSQPTWNLSKGGSTTDNTVTWTEVTGNETYQAPGAWAAPYARWGVPLGGSYVSAAAIKSNGTGTYAVNDVLTVSGGTLYGDAATVRVTAASAGRPTAIAIISGGSYLAAPTLTGAATTGGGGSGVTLNLTMANQIATTDTIYLGSLHAETQATALTITGIATGTLNNNQTKSICVNQNGSGTIPPVAADIIAAPTASITTTGASALALNGIGFASGIAISAGSGASAANVGVNGPGIVTLQDCSLTAAGTLAASIRLGADYGSCKVFLNGVVVSFGAAASSIVCGAGRVIWRNTPSAIVGATLPTTLISSPTQLLVLDGIDLSALGVGNTLIGRISSGSNVMLIDCKLGSSVVVAATASYIYDRTVDLVRCDSGGTTYRQERYWFEGVLMQSTAITRTGGATDGTTPVSWAVTMTANVEWWHPFECFPIAEWNGRTATNLTATVHGIINSATLPNNDEVWLEVDYFGSASSPQASVVTGTKSNILASGTAQAADASAWDGAATARANTTAYTLGQVIKLASNPGCIFFCTSAGTSAGTEPAGYVSAVDGGSVTDGGATFRAGVRFSMTTTLSAPQPAMAGALRGIVKIAKASATVYIDPLLVLA